MQRKSPFQVELTQQKNRLKYDNFKLYSKLLYYIFILNRGLFKVISFEH